MFFILSYRDFLAQVVVGNLKVLLEVTRFAQQRHEVIVNVDELNETHHRSV